MAGTGSMTNVFENKVRDHLHAGAPLTQPVFEVALLDVVTDGEAGTVTEVTGGTYARKVSGTDFLWNRTVQSRASNDTALLWSNDSGGPWTIEGIGLYVLTELDMYAAEPAPITVNDGEDIEIAIGALTVDYD